MSTEPTESSKPLATGKSGAAVVQPPSDNPYQFPSAPIARECGPGDNSVGGDGIKPVRWASMVAMVGLSCSLFMAAFSIYVTLNMYWLSLVSHGGASVAPTQSAGAVRLAEVVNAIEQFVIIMTAIPFLIWFHRCYRNLAWLYVEGIKYSTRWAIGGWFIPIVNLIRPYQVAREIWDASNPDVHADEGPQGWLLKRSARLVQIWWVLGLAPGVVWFVANSFIKQPSLVNWKVGIWLFIVGNLINGGAAVAAMLVIRRLDARQAARQNRLRTIFASHPLTRRSRNHTGPGYAGSETR